MISLTGNVNQSRQCIECIKISYIVQYLQQWLDHFSLFLSLLHLNSCSEADQQLDMQMGIQPLLSMRLAMLVMTQWITLFHKCSGLKDGLPAVRTPTNISGTNGRLTSTLSFTFAASDAGVYQCVFTDTSRSEIFATVPTRLDTGEYCSQ